MKSNVVSAKSTSIEKLCIVSRGTVDGRYSWRLTWLLPESYSYSCL